VYAALILVLSANGRAATVPCDGKMLTTLVGDAELAFVHMDAQLFSAASAALDQSLTCQTEPLSAIQIAAYHRVRALAAFFEENEPATVLSFQACLATMPGYALPIEIAPEGHPLRKQFEQAKLFSAGDVFDLPAPADGWITIDGNRTLAAPSARPFVFQRFGSTGQVLSTAYVAVGTPVPTYPMAVDDTTLQNLDDVAPIVTRNAPNGFLIGTGIVLGAASAGLYGGAFVFRQQYDEAVAAGDEPKIRSTYQTTNAMVIGSGGALALGTSFLLVGVF
jgi:hypothetical protein